jgi:hypothetical protein
MAEGRSIFDGLSEGETVPQFIAFESKLLLSFFQF